MNRRVASEQPHPADTPLAGKSGEDRGVVVTLAPDDPRHAHGHEGATQASISRRLAALKGYAFAGEYDPSRRYPGRLYFVPHDTLVGAAAARALGILTEDDLFGGVVPQPFVATKTITHPLVDPGATAPDGWSH